MEINDVSWPQVNEAGDVLIHANLRTGTPEPGPGPAIYIEQNGQIRLVTVIGAPAPANPPGVTFFNGFGNTVLNNVGQVAFRSQVPDQSRGVWIWTDGQIEEVARTGTPLPTGPAGSISSPLNLQFNDSGVTAFVSRIETRTRIGMFSGDGSEIRVIADSALQPPGVEAGAVWDSIYHAPTFSSRGQAAFLASMVPGPGGITFANDQGIWTEGSGTLQLLAREGDTAPGHDGAYEFLDFNLPAIDNTGTTAFRGQVVPVGQRDEPTTLGIWNANAEGFDVVAFEGDDVPAALGENTRYTTMSAPLVSNGNLAFLTGMQTTRDDGTTMTFDGLVSRVDGAWNLVARTGQVVSDIEGTSTIAAFSYTANLPVVLNSRGQLAFVAELDDGREGIFAQDIYGFLRTIVLEDDIVEIGPGRQAIVERLRFGGNTGNESGRLSGFSNRGHVAFFAQVGELGVATRDVAFVSNLVIPEPASVILLFVSLVGASMIRLAIRIRQ